MEIKYDKIKKERKKRKKKPMDNSQNKKEKQIERLIYFIESHPDPREMKRALAVKLALQGYVYSAIENILNVSPAFVTKWKHNFQKKGIEGLRLSYKGAKKN